MAFGIICEYNPFHNGHLHQINEIKKISDEPIICVMSGNFVQRGECAAFDKYKRAEMALRCGADVVLELPVPYCIASAEFFASAGVEILHRVGAERISFGSETGDAERIKRLARLVLSDEFSERVKNASQSEGNAKVYFDILSDYALSADFDGKLNSNDILAVEYTKAIIKNGYDMEIYPIKREGSCYNDRTLSEGELPSASAIREQLSDGMDGRIRAFMPLSVCKIIDRERPSSMYIASNALLYGLRVLDAESIEVAVSDRGLIHKIINEANVSVTYDELLSRLKGSRYTEAAVHRAILFLLFGIKQSDLCRTVAYTFLLGASGKGREYLSQLKKRENSLRIITKPADVLALTEKDAVRQCELNMRADRLYTLCLPTPKESGYFLKKGPVITG